MTSYQSEPGSDDLLDREAKRKLSEIPEPTVVDDVEHTDDDEPSERRSDPS